MERIMVPVKRQAFEFGRVINPVRCNCIRCDFMNCPHKNYAVKMKEQKHSIEDFWEEQADQLRIVNKGKYDKIDGLPLQLTYAMITELMERCIPFPANTFWEAGICTAQEDDFNQSIVRTIDIIRISRQGKPLRIGGVDVRSGRMDAYDLDLKQIKCVERISEAFKWLNRKLVEECENADTSCIGWMDRSGRLYKCNHGQHARLAQKLGASETMLENRGWVKIFGEGTFFDWEYGYYCTMRTSIEQKAALRELGYRAEDFNG